MIGFLKVNGYSQTTIKDLEDAVALKDVDIMCVWLKPRKGWKEEGRRRRAGDPDKEEGWNHLQAVPSSDPGRKACIR